MHGFCITEQHKMESITNNTDSFATRNGSTDIDDLVRCARSQMDTYLFNTFSMGPAVSILLVLAFCRKRKNICPKFCHGRPGLAVPLNLLDEFENRWSYACAFGAITNTLIGILTGLGVQPTEDKNAFGGITVLLTFYRAFETCLNYFPFFACLYTDQILLGSILGFLYAALWVFLKFMQISVCPNPIPEVLPFATLISQIPTIICLVILLIRFSGNVILYFNGKHRGSSLHRIEDSVVFPFQIQYVKELLKKPPSEVDWDAKELSFKEKIKAYWKKYYYDERCHFKYSTRILCTLVVISMCNYQMSLTQTTISASARKFLEGIASTLVNISGIINQNSTRSFEQNVNTVLTMGTVSWNVSTALAFVVMSFSITGTLSNYRTHLLALFKGDRSYFPPKYKATSADYLANSMKFSGYQIAYVIWGHLVMVLALLVVTMTLSLALFLPALNGNWVVVEFLLRVVVLPFIVSLLIRLLQHLLSKYGFLQNKLSPEDDDQPLAITNRRALHVANYFFFVANIATGLFSSLMRILKGLLFGVFYIGRLDQCVMMSGFEGSDNGFTSYVGMLEVEHSLNHPVMRVFCHIVSQLPSEVAGRDDQGHPRNSDAKMAKSLSQLSSQIEAPECISSTENETFGYSTKSTRYKTQTRSRLRWWVLYTLINNPQLIHYRHLHDREKDPLSSLVALPNAMHARYKLYTQIKENLREMDIEFMKERRMREDSKDNDEMVLLEMENDTGMEESNTQNSNVLEMKPSCKRRSTKSSRSSSPLKMLTGVNNKVHENSEDILQNSCNQDHMEDKEYDFSKKLSVTNL